MELSSDVMMQQINAGGTKVSSTLQTIKSTESGVITYYTDGYEKKTPETLSEDDFNKNNYKKTSLKSGDILDTGSTVFKIVSDESWNIVCQVTEEQAKVIQGEEKLRFTINDSPIEISSSYSILPRGESYFVVLPLKKYMVDYIDERFLNIEIILNKFEGLKVPNSALQDKEVYKIPKEYINESEKSSSKSVTVRRFENADATAGDATGDSKTTKVNLIIYKSDDAYYYVDEDTFFDTDQILGKEGADVSPVLSLDRDTLTGVYLANTGVAEYIEVNVVKTQDEFSILKSDENLKEFDNIVLDASQVSVNQTLY